MAAQLESEVALPLAGVQQSLLTQVAFWDHSSALSAAVMGLYTVPKARILTNLRAARRLRHRVGHGWGPSLVIFVGQPAQQR